jgi:chromosome segregation ATPase
MDRNNKSLFAKSAPGFSSTTCPAAVMLDDLLATVNEELAADYPDSNELAEQSKRLEESWQQARRETQLAQESIRERLTRKNQIARLIFEREQRRAEIQINFGRFEQLETVYASDIHRLEAIEEAGFILSLAGDRSCPLCGAPPEDQQHSHGLADIKRAQGAADVEINKIQKQQSELTLTIDQLGNEGLRVEKSLDDLESELAQIENELSQLAPTASAKKQRFDEVLEVRDHVRRGLDLLEQRKSLTERKDEL